jgi:1-deoxy-D-xylulose-5-phosphate reductoisomerase
MVDVSIVGSTGSIGSQAIDVVGRDPDRFHVVAIGARRSVATLAEQARQLHPDIVAIADKDVAPELEALLPYGVELRVGDEALASIAEIGDIVLNGVVGFAGLPVTITALRTGRRLALANKESLIAGAPIVQTARATRGAEIVPVDSEHCAIHQCLGERRHVGWQSLGPDGPVAAADVARLIVTASGGPFRGRTTTELASVTIAEALAHPTWKMGPKITIDSSTLMNKGLEVIEAHELFGVGFDEIEVVVHPQSIVHSMVEFRDGATIAQLSNPDMRLPIGYSLAYPERFGFPFGSLDWRTLSGLEFATPDLATFRCLALAYEAGRAGGSAPAWLSAANEIAVEAFFAERISWLGIADTVEETLAQHEATEFTDVEDVLAADEAARRTATSIVDRRSRAA